MQPRAHGQLRASTRERDGLVGILVGLERAPVREHEHRQPHALDVLGRAEEARERVVLDVDPLVRHAVPLEELAVLQDVRRRPVADHVERSAEPWNDDPRRLLDRGHYAALLS